MKKRWIGAAVLLGVLACGLVYWRLSRTHDMERAASEVEPTASPEASHVLQTHVQPAVIAGTVVRADDGAAVAGAMVELSPVGTDAGESRTTRADASGAWSIDEVTPGAYNASAAAAGYVPTLVRELTVAEGAREHLDLRLEAGGHLVSGTVTDVSGGAVDEALVHFTPVHGMLSARADHGFAAMSDEAGRYRLSVADGRYLAEAIHADYVSAQKTVELRGGERVVDFALAPGGAIEGRVLSLGTGAPVPGAEVHYVREAIVSLPGVGMTGGGRRGIEIADADGRFRITGLQSGVVRMTARAAGGTTAADTAVMLGIGEEVGGVELFIEKAFSIRGRVVIAGSRAPAAKVRVIASRESGEVVPARQETGKDGRFVILGVLPGNYRLRIHSDRFLGSEFGTPVSVADEDRTGVEIEVQAAATISGRVEPAAMADVSMEVGEDTRLGPTVIRFGSVRTKEDGSFRLGPVRPGTIRLRAVAADGRAGRAQVEVAAEDVDGVVIPLEKKGSLAGKVTSVRRKPVTDAVVVVKEHTPNREVTMIVNGRDMNAHQSPTHEDGSFLVSGLDGGDYEISVKDAQGQILAWAHPDDRDYPRAPLRVSLREGEAREGVDLRVEARDGVIRGLAKDPDGNPAPDVWITATPAALPVLPSRPHAPSRTPGKAAPRREVRRQVMAFVTSEGDGGGGGFSGALPPVLTDAEGRFEITGLRQGKYDLLAEGLHGTARGFAQGVETGTDVVVQLHSLARIEGTVVFGGKPVSEFRVELSGKDLRAKQVRDQDGRFTLFRVDPGARRLEVSSSLGSASVDVMVAAGKATEVTVELERLAAVRGRVVTPNGAPVAGALVVTSPRVEGRSELRILADDTTPATDAEGRFEIGRQPGAYTLVVLGREEAGPVVMRPITVAGEDQDLGDLVTGEVPLPPPTSD